MVSSAGGWRRQDGYTLVGLMVLIAVTSIGLAAAAQSLVTRDRRAREAELIWRGRQYIRAIACYQQSGAAEPLTRLEQLVDASCLRRLYEEPMAADGEWRVLTAQDAADGTLEELAGPPVVPGSPGRPEADAEYGEQGERDEEGLGEGSFGLGLSSMGRNPSRQGSGRQGGLGGDFELGSGFNLGFGGLDAGDASNRIIGVSSTVDRESLRVYGQRKNYRSWLFVAVGPG